MKRKIIEFTVRMILTAWLCVMVYFETGIFTSITLFLCTLGIEGNGFRIDLLVPKKPNISKSLDSFLKSFVDKDKGDGKISE